MTTSTIRWGVLGYARIARMSFLPALARSGNARLQAIATRGSDKLDAIRQETGCGNVHASYEALIADPDVDAIYIPLPNSMHKPWTLKALAAGKHVLCEKPLGLDAAEAREMADAARAAQRLLMEAFMYRYTERSRKLKEIIDSGVLGSIRHVNAQFRFFLDRPNTIKVQPELGGGALYDVGCYPINLLGLITGRTPIAVHAEAEFDNGVDVNLSALFRYEDGLLATIHTGFNAFGRQGAEIIGTQGVLEVPDPFLDFRGHLSLHTREGTRLIPVVESDRYRGEVEDFSAAILEGRQPLFGLDETIRNAEVLDRVAQALKR
ncbi:Gfo/Idh/MocA family protein [Uliginosibacterium sp. H1]|uniref:Gfo/Idh/MocA family protein n=1 Tax=Uliginosibacterium sp. H1 TaxID=3114757 RepID=UPI002E17CE8F|nr:Gfo/Idh/MocA family oxidoreductase [Uliginosibacterium sp. H1]